MKNKINESNDYKCVLCETGEGDKHGLQCSENNKPLTDEELKEEFFSLAEEMQSRGFDIELNH